MYVALVLLLLGFCGSQVWGVPVENVDQPDSKVPYFSWADIFGNFGKKELKELAKVAEQEAENADSKESSSEDAHRPPPPPPPKKRRPFAYCHNNEPIALKDYCYELQDGLYFDPWNPMCGFVNCTGQRPMRDCCMKGSWMGVSDMAINRESSCRQPLPWYLVAPDGKCAQGTDYKDMCTAADKVMEMNKLV